jgi:enterobactin synthetase component D
MAVALVTEDRGWTLGIDIERRTLGRLDISRRVLTEPELAEIGHLTPAQRGENIMLRFSLKESIYKAIDPYLQRRVGFREASVSLLDHGQARVRLELRSGGPLEVEGWWSTGDGFVLTSARARPGRGDPLR